MAPLPLETPEAAVLAPVRTEALVPVAPLAAEPGFAPAAVVAREEPILAEAVEESPGQRLLSRSAAKAVRMLRKDAAVMTKSASAPDIGSGVTVGVRFFDLGASDGSAQAPSVVIDDNPYRAPAAHLARAEDAPKRRAWSAWLRQREKEASSRLGTALLAAGAVNPLVAAALPSNERLPALPPGEILLLALAAGIGVVLAVNAFAKLTGFGAFHAVRQLRVARRRALAGKN